MPAGKRKGTNGAAKGAAFERLTARQLSLWVSAGKSDDLLWRSGGSGARSTSRFKRHGKHLEFQSADIALVHPDAAPFADRFVVECKFYRQLDIHRLFYDPLASVVNAWWVKVRGEAEALGKEPLLIIKGNLYPALILMPPSRGTRCELVCTVHALSANVVMLHELLESTTFATFARLPRAPRAILKATD